jgi:hypothetical protein
VELNYKIGQILNHLDHIDSHVARECNKDWLQEELLQLREELESLLNIEAVGEIEIVECEVCGGCGFSGRGTGYDSVCDNCGGKGEHPKWDK